MKPDLILADWGAYCASTGAQMPAQGIIFSQVPFADLNLDNLKDIEFLQTEFLSDPTATFQVVSDDEWYTRPSRYVPVRPEGEEVANLLTQAQAAVKEARLYWINKALAALGKAGFRPREWKVETIREKAGTRTGSIWLVAD